MRPRWLLSPEEESEDEVLSDLELESVAGGVVTDTYTGEPMTCNAEAACFEIIDG